MTAPLVYSWFNVTTWADESWENAQRHYWEAMARARESWNREEAEASAWRQLMAVRKDYRHRILSWYRKLLVPMKIGDCVPNSVAELLAEEWDLASRRSGTSPRRALVLQLQPQSLRSFH